MTSLARCVVSLRRIPHALALLLLALFALPGQAGDPIPVVESRLAVVDGEGSPISTAEVGDTVTLRVRAEDVRSSPLGVFAAYLDILYDDALATAGAVSHDSAVPSFRRGAIGMAGLVDEAGAVFGSLTPPGGGERLVLSVPFTLRSEGTLTFQGEPADDASFTNVLVFGLPGAVPVQYDDASITIIDPAAPTLGGVARTLLVRLVRTGKTITYRRKRSRKSLPPSTACAASARGGW